MHAFPMEDATVRLSPVGLFAVIQQLQQLTPTPVPEEVEHPTPRAVVAVAAAPSLLKNAICTVTHASPSWTSGAMLALPVQQIQIALTAIHSWNSALKAVKLVFPMGDATVRLL